MTETCFIGLKLPCEECYYKLCENENFSESFDVELCDFTGEECFGDKMFCEECEVILEEKVTP